MQHDIVLPPPNALTITAPGMSEGSRHIKRSAAKQERIRTVRSFIVLRFIAKGI